MQQQSNVKETTTAGSSRNVIQRNIKPLHLETLREHDQQHPWQSPLPASSSNGEDDAPKTCWQWIAQNIWPGLGLFGESYILFSLGLITPTWKVLFPDCFDEIECSPRLLHSLTYSVVLGIIVGMISVGYMANTIGRRKGSILTASFMAGGALGLLAISIVLVNNPPYLFRTMSVLLFLFGIGVGGEYPLSASSASEKAMAELKHKRLQETMQGHTTSEQPTYQQAYRGRQVQTVFSMQGMGIWFNSVIMTILLVVTDQTGANGTYDQPALLLIWRVSYAIGAGILLFVLLSRYFYLEESVVWEEDNLRRGQLQRSGANASVNSSKAPGPMLSPTAMKSELPFPSPHGTFVSSLSVPTLVYDKDQDDQAILNAAPSIDEYDGQQDVSRTMLLIRNYGMRVFGTSTAWLLWDIAFYGNKLFQSSFLLALTGDDTTLIQFSVAASLNSSVALLGYFGAALLVDHPLVGRLRLQQGGFLVTGALFVGCGFLFDRLSSVWLIAMYLGSSFFGQLGPNCTTFILPAEVVPTEVRTLCHGIAAASGKIGALIAAVMFNYLADVDMFLLSGYASFAACFISYWCIPETNGLDLYELDKKWRLTQDGRKGDYTGLANHPDYLSTHERQRKRKNANAENEIEDMDAYQMW